MTVFKSVGAMYLLYNSSKKVEVRRYRCRRRVGRRLRRSVYFQTSVSFDPTEPAGPVSVHPMDVTCTGRFSPPSPIPEVTARAVRTMLYPAASRFSSLPSLLNTVPVLEEAHPPPLARASNKENRMIGACKCPCSLPCRRPEWTGRRRGGGISLHAGGGGEGRRGAAATAGNGDWASWSSPFSQGEMVAERTGSRVGNKGLDKAAGDSAAGGSKLGTYGVGGAASTVRNAAARAAVASGSLMVSVTFSCVERRRGRRRMCTLVVQVYRVPLTSRWRRQKF